MMVQTKRSSNTDRSLYAWAIARIALGIIFLWAFFDKLFGLGFSTCRDAKTEAVTVLCKQAWIQGGSPTLGFLKFATKGPLASFYQGLAGNSLIDILFMGGLFLIGFALIAGIGMRLATVSGVLLMLMMWSSLLPPATNPIIDEHIVFSIILLGLLASNKNQVWGLRTWWIKQSIVKRLPILE